MFTATNTHILMPEFDYVQPDTLEEVFSHIAAHGDAARVIAGGTDLLVQMKMGQEGCSLLINLASVKEFQSITSKDGLAIGSNASIRSIADSEYVCEHYLALAEACKAFSTIPIMIMGTIGGNLCNGSPAADTAPALLTFDAVVQLVSADGMRELPLDMFFAGPGRINMKKGELLQSIHLGKPEQGTGSAFVKISRVKADISQVCVAVSLVRNSDKITSCKIAFGSVAPTPVRIRPAEEYLIGQNLSKKALVEAARIVMDEVSPITDVRATAEYRKNVSGVIVRDALTTAWRRAGREEA